MDASKKDYSELTNEPVKWINELNNHEEEIQRLQDNLEKVVQSDLKKEMLAGIEHFQNQFIVQNDVIDELKHRARDFNTELSRLVAGNISKDYDPDSHHSLIKEKMSTFGKLFKELKDEFNNFYSKHSKS